MRYIIKKSKIKKWGYEIIGKNFHNIAPTIEAAINYLENRFGDDVKFTIKKD